MPFPVRHWSGSAAREMARADGVSISRLLVDAALNPPEGLKRPQKQEAHAGTPCREEPLMLAPDEQRELHDALIKLAADTDAMMLPTSTYGMNIQDCVRYLFNASVDGFVRSGRVDETYILFGRVFDDPVRKAQIQQWIKAREK